MMMSMPLGREKNENVRLTERGWGRRSTFSRVLTVGLLFLTATLLFRVSAWAGLGVGEDFDGGADLEDDGTAEVVMGGSLLMAGEGADARAGVVMNEAAGGEDGREEFPASGKLGVLTLSAESKIESGQAGATGFSHGSPEIVPMPEPLALGGVLGLLGLVVLREKSRVQEWLAVRRLRV